MDTQRNCVGPVRCVAFCCVALCGCRVCLGGCHCGMPIGDCATLLSFGGLKGSRRVLMCLAAVFKWPHGVRGLPEGFGDFECTCCQHLQYQTQQRCWAAGHYGSQRGPIAGAAHPRVATGNFPPLHPSRALRLWQALESFIATCTSSLRFAACPALCRSSFVQNRVVPYHLVLPIVKAPQQLHRRTQVMQRFALWKTGCWHGSRIDSRPLDGHLKVGNEAPKSPTTECLGLLGAEGTAFGCWLFLTSLSICLPGCSSA